MLKLIQPPLSDDNISLKNAITDICNFLSEFIYNGIRPPSFTQAQIDSMTDKSQSGVIVINSTTEKPQASYLDNGVVKFEDII